MERIKTLIDKEWAEAFKNKMVLGTVVFMPIIFMILPLFQLALMRNIPASELNDMPAAILAMCQAQNFSPSECMQGFLVNQFLLLFLLIPLAVPVTIAAYSIVGEKVTRSLEPLLATPTSTTKLLLGKGLAAALPGILTAWVSYVLFLAGARILSVSDRVFNIFVNPMWLVAMLVLAPLLTLMAVSVGISLHRRTSDPRAAEQLGSLIIL